MNSPDYRHIIAAIVIIALISITAALVLISHKKTVETAALIINSKTITEQEFNRLFEKKPARQDTNGFIDSVIMKELLVQEAVKAGIQNEEPFRQSVRDHYEQTLVKHIVDRKFTSIMPAVDDRTIDRYIELSDKILDLSVISYRHADDISKGRPEKEEHLRLPFNRLSMDVKYDVLTLREGELSTPSCADTEEDCSAFRVNHIIADDQHTTKESDRNKIRQLLMNHKREMMFNEWLDGIRKKAVVKKESTAIGR